MHFSETYGHFPRRENRATVTCPHCGMSKTVQIDPLRARTGPVKMLCSCGPVFGVLVELRKTWRKEVRFHGQYSAEPSNNMHKSMVVKNVSPLGLGFATPSRHLLKKDDTLHVTFTLDDSARSVIKREVVVKYVRETFVGCAFVDKDVTDALSHYLNTGQPHTDMAPSAAVKKP